MSSSPRQLRTFSVLVAMLLLLAPYRQAAGNAPSSQDELLVSQGIELFANGSFEAAARQLKKARKKVTSSKLLGKVYLYLGLIAATENKKRQAHEAFRKALMYNPTLKLDRQRHKSDYWRAFERVRSQTVADYHIALKKEYPEAQLFIDGRPMGALPAKGALVAGEHRIEIRSKQGESLHRRTLAVMAGRTLRLQITLGQPSTMSDGKNTKDLLAGRGEEQEDARDNTRPGPSPWRWAPWIVAGAATVAAGVAVAMGLSAQSDRDEACSLLGPTNASCDDRGYLRDPQTADRYRDLESAISGKTTISTITWITSGVLATAAIVIWLLDRPFRESNREARTRLLFKLDGSAALRWHF